MKKALFILCAFPGIFLFAPDTRAFVLDPPNTNRGLPVMKALLHRASVESWNPADLALSDLSDLLWAANGINRSETGKRTAPSAMNAQDVDVYVLMKSGAYLYNARKHSLDPVAVGDFRKLAAGRQEKAAVAPVICLLVSDISRFTRGEESLKKSWAALDAGIVSQNISLFCSSAGLATRPRASMDQDRLRKTLKLKDSQLLMLNHPVSYPR